MSGRVKQNGHPVHAVDSTQAPAVHPTILFTIASSHRFHAGGVALVEQPEDAFWEPRSTPIPLSLTNTMRRSTPREPILITK
jgi:hypothetical protein